MAKKNKSIFSATILALATFVMIFGYTNCGDVKINPTVNVANFSSMGNFCLSPDKKINWNKYLFIIDKSGSNRTSDPDDVRRADNIQRFLDKHAADEYTKWGFIQFGQDINSKSTSYIMDPVTGKEGFSDSQAMQTAIQTHRSTPNAGCTPYLVALVKARTMMETDMRDHKEEASIYHIFFMSDGMPDNPTNSNGCGDGVVNKTPDDPHASEVKNIAALSPGRVFFNTVYYNPVQTRAEAPDGLEYLAQIGKGVFKNLENQNTLDFDSLIGGVETIPHMIKGPRLFVKNLNAAFCSDGRIDVDSDADGLCDKDEAKYTKIYQAELKGKVFDPLNRNSLNKFYNDSFILKFQLENRKILPECSPERSTDEDHDLLNECEETLLNDVAANGPTEDWNRMLSQKYGKSASKTNPDSDGDTFLDMFEFNQFKLPSSAVNFTNTRDQYGHGLEGIDLMVENRHPMSPEIFGPNQYDAKTLFAGKKMYPDGRLYNCYNFSQMQLALYQTQSFLGSSDPISKSVKHGVSENLIMIYYISVPEDDPNGLGILNYSIQKLRYQPKGGLGGLRFDKFEEYVVPKEP